MMIRALFFSLVLAASVSSVAAATFSGHVTRVTDGDTLWVKPDRGSVKKLRLQGLDAPESCQAGGKEATQALERLVMNQRVQVKASQMDAYGRGLARITVRGEDVGARLVRSGQAWSYRWKDDPGPYVTEENAARTARRGLFAQAHPEQPGNFRKRHGACPVSSYAKSGAPAKAAPHRFGKFKKPWN